MKSVNTGDQKQTRSWSDFVDYIRSRSDSSSILFTALATCALSLLICAFFILPGIEAVILGTLQHEEHRAVKADARHMEQLIELQLELLGIGGQDFAAEILEEDDIQSSNELLATYFNAFDVDSITSDASTQQTGNLLTNYFNRIEIYDEGGKLLYSYSVEQNTSSDKKDNSWLLALITTDSAQAVDLIKEGDTELLRMVKKIKTNAEQGWYVTGYRSLDHHSVPGGEGIHQIRLRDKGLAEDISPYTNKDGFLILFTEKLEPYGLVMEVQIDFRQVSDELRSLLWVRMSLMGMGLVLLFFVCILLLTDMLKKKNSETAISQQEKEDITAKLAGVMNAVVDAVVITDSHGEVEYFNKAAEDVFGYRRDEIIGNNVSMLVSEDYFAKHDGYIANYLKSGESEIIGGSREVSAKHKDGRVFALELEIQAHMDKISDKTTFIALARDLTSRNSSEAELARYIENLKTEKIEFQLAKEKAELLVENKKALIATVSHEIRTPMNGVLGMTGLLANTSLDEEQKTYLEAIRDSGNSLLFLINDLLDFSKLEANKLELDDRDFLPIKLIESAVSLVATLAAEKGIQMAAHIEPMVPQSLNGDPGRIRQIVMNYLSNAVKFTEKGGSVDVHLSCVEQKGNRVIIHLEVRDTGIGISEESMEVIFKDFSQADSSISSRFGGTGLGLAISKRIAELMNGSVGVQSEAGKGSVFWADLELGVGQTILQPLTNVGPDLSLLNAMVIDSHPLNREVFVSQLRRHGIKSIEFADVDSALEQLKRSLVRQQLYNVILLDEELPGADEVSEFVIRNKVAPCFLVMTSVQGQASTKEMRDKGVYLSVIKPIKESALIDIMSQISEELVGLKNKDENGSDGKVGDHSELVLPDLSAQELNLKVLIAEDSEVSQQYAMGLLLSWGCDVEAVDNGLQAVEAVSEKYFDLVLMDMIMPEMNGIDATKKIRSLSGDQKNVPIIGITGNILDEDQALFLEAGVGEVIIKPIDRAELWRAIERQMDSINAVVPSRIDPKAAKKRALSKTASSETASSETASSETVSSATDSKSKIRH